MLGKLSTICILYTISCIYVVLYYMYQVWPYRYILHDIDLSSTTVRSTTVLGRYMHVPPSGRGSGASRRPTPRSVRSRQCGFELTAGLVQSTLCSASNPCPLTYHFVSRPPTRASMAPFGLSSSYLFPVCLCVCVLCFFMCVMCMCV